MISYNHKKGREPDGREERVSNVVAMRVWVLSKRERKRSGINFFKKIMLKKVENAIINLLEFVLKK